MKILFLALEISLGLAAAPWVEYAAEGHRFYIPANRIDFWSRMERFLDRQIGQHQSSSQAQGQQ